IINDLPVTPSYVDSVVRTGAKLLIKSKWMNGIAVETEDSLVLQRINSFSFVSDIEPIAAYTIIDSADTSGIESIPLISSPVLTNNLLYDEELYGSGFNQISMMHGEYLHELGFRGEQMMIAVLDAGFYRADSIAAFDSLRMNNRILGCRDFVSGIHDSIFYRSTHGMSVLSTMGGNLPGELVGTAPAANYWLLRTEDAGTEFRIEEYNWAAGAEFADSVGADVINSSLGYTTFNDSAMDYSYSDLNGDFAVVTRAADFAAQKGMIVVTSAGNQGNSRWRYIGAPADADSILAVGAVDAQGQITGFSSRGPSFDGRVKPNVVAQGRDVAIVNGSGSISTGNGTSFASPVTAGLVTCLWQAFPEKSAQEIISNVIETASHFSHPNDSFGYGIPDFRLAYLKMLEEKGSPYVRARQPIAYPNPFSDALHVMVFAEEEGLYFVEIFDALGKRIVRQEQHLRELRYHDFQFSGLDTLQRGVYLIRIGCKGDTRMVRAVKL
ncbi:MAG TPA: S8 family serine peptidase, partial [Chitinophagales bacterium]|nr:S8 family serine peptidase [Chitinophagales bacterium]